MEGRRAVVNEPGEEQRKKEERNIISVSIIEQRNELNPDCTICVCV